MSKHYTAQTATGVAIGGSFSKKSAAVEAAMAHTSENGVETQVLSPAGNVVETFVPSNRAKPNTRTSDKAFELGEGVELPEGYEVAYDRTRINTLVLRADDPEDAESKYLVFNTLTGDSVPAGGTRDACAITTQLAIEAREQKAAEKAAEKDAKAKAKAKKAAEAA